MTTEHTNKILTTSQVAIRKLLPHKVDAEPHKPSAIRPRPIGHNKEAACEWYFDRVITKECEMTAATLVNRQQ